MGTRRQLAQANASSPALQAMPMFSDLERRDQFDPVTPDHTDQTKKSEDLVPSV
jgi:hypothetical protein